jgi:hypothetical protein
MIDLKEAARAFVCAHMSENITLENAFVCGALFAYLNGDWRTLKQKLPREFEDVLVVDKYGTVAVARYAPRHDIFDSRDEILSPNIDDILYWQPLPQIPPLKLSEL